jgi:uncharacterized membrane protein YgdD (TMEM256/DUF423 family)
LSHIRSADSQNAMQAAPAVDERRACTVTAPVLASPGPKGQTLLQTGPEIEESMRDYMGFRVAVAALNGGIAVVAGAFATHGLEAAGQQTAEWMRTGAQYQMWHALALLGGAFISGGSGRRAFDVAWAAWLVGILLFCGALYGLALGGPRWLGMVAPVGGTAFVLGWLAAVVGGVTLRR